MLGFGHFLLEGDGGGLKVAMEVGVSLVAHFFGGLHLHELHVEFEDLFEELGGDELLFLGAGGAGCVGGGLGLLFELDAFEGEEVLGAEDRVFQGAVSVVEAGGGGEGGLLLVGGEAVGVELAGLGVEGFFEGLGVQVEEAGKGEGGEVVGWRLHRIRVMV